jgi:cephalosporin hydroxylase
MSASPKAPGGFPPSVHANLDEPVRNLWSARLAQVLHDTYAGVPLAKFPEDLRVYEHLLWASQADTVIELGTFCGGSALWFRDRLRSFASYGRCASSRVVSVDIDLSYARRWLSEADQSGERDIFLIEADVRDPSLPSRVAAAIPEGARCLVVEDGPHTYEATRAALGGFARFVPRGGWFVVEDGVVDEVELRAAEDWPRGVHRALAEWLATPEAHEFSTRRDVELYGITTNHRGYLQRS